MQSLREGTISHFRHERVSFVSQVNVGIRLVWSTKAEKDGQFDKSDFHTLDHSTDQFNTDLKQFAQTPKTISDVLKDNIVNLKPTIEVELEWKRALKIIVALHFTFHRATDPTFLSEPAPVFKSASLEILADTDIDEVLQ